MQEFQDAQTVDQYQLDRNQETNPENWTMEELIAQAIMEGIGSAHPFAPHDPNSPPPPMFQSYQKIYNAT